MNNGIEKALKLIETGDMEQGLEQLNSLIKEADHNTKYSIAEIYYELGLVDLAKEVIDELILLYPDEGELYTFMAELLIDLDQEDEAIEILLEIKEDDLVYCQAQLLLADLYQLQGLEEVAELKLLNAGRKMPEEPVVLFGLGEFYLSRGDYLKSIPYYKRVLPSQEQLDGINIALRLAEAYSATGYFEEAITYYQLGITENERIDDHFGYGYTALQLGNYSVAIQQFETVIDMDESFSSVYPYLGEAYEEEGKINEALQIIKKGITIDEYNEALYVQGARIALNHRYLDEGEMYLRKVIAINPANFEGANMLANLLKKEQRYDDLHELIVYLKDHNEEDPLFDWFLATAKLALDEYEEALTLFEQVYNTLSHDSDFLEEYAQALLEGGYKQKAKQLIEQAIQLDETKAHLKELVFYLEEQ